MSWTCPASGTPSSGTRSTARCTGRRVAKADGFIVVIAPPRPANDATIKTVNLLLSCGVNPERIVFAFNKMGDINARIGGRMRRLTLDGLAGPSTPDDARLVDMARGAFNKDLCAMVRNGQLEGKFPLEQVVAYEALSGWNLFEVLDAVLRSLPGDTLMRWRDTVNRAAKDHQRRTEERIALEAFHHSRKMAELEEQMKRLGGRQAGGQPGRGGDGKKAPSGTADPAADGDAGKRGRAAAVKGKADQDHQQAETERQQAEAERKRRLEEAESKRRLEEAESKRRLEEAARQRRQQEADKRRLEEGARQRQQEEAARQRRQKEAEDERNRLEAERERLEAQRRELLAEQERLERQREAARQIATRRDAHLGTVAEKFAYWAAEKVDIAVANVKNVASAVKRWWRGG